MLMACAAGAAAQGQIANCAFIRIFFPDADCTDYDGDGDSLIDIRTAAQLQAITHDLAGRGNATAAAYQAAFPEAAPAMGCGAGACVGYELLNDITLSGNWSPIGGGIAKAVKSRNDDAPPDSIRYTRTFEGNGHVIRGLRIRFLQGGSGNYYHAGLFRALGANGIIRNVGLVDVDVARANRDVDGRYVGSLVGYNSGKIAASYALGSVEGYLTVGGLVGANEGEIIASYTNVGVSTFQRHSGGLAGRVGSGGKIIASYALGRINPAIRLPFSNTHGGLVGEVHSGGQITNSYSSELSSLPDWVESAPSGSVRTSQELRERVDATGIFADWDDLNVDGGNDDDPWNFGSCSEFPVLVAGTNSTRLQRASQPTLSVSASLSRDGDDTIAEGSAATYAVELGACIGQSTTLSWAVEPTGVGSAHAVFADFETTRGTVTITAPARRAVFEVRARRDSVLPESDELFRVRLSVPAGATGLRLSDADAVVSAIAAHGDGENYDTDGDGLIEVATTSQLAAIRHDLGGVGIAGVSVSVAGMGSYLAAFPFFDRELTCPGTCTGYELSNDLDLSSAGNWTPIGGGFAPASGNYNVPPPVSIQYGAVFEGNGYVIRNMEITRAAGSVRYDHVGLFGVLSATSVVRSVGLSDVSVNTTNSVHVGALAGYNFGKVAASYVAGGSVNGSRAVGGLVGSMNGGIVIASYSNVSVNGSGQRVGGLIGSDEGGSPAAIVSASYTVGVPTGGNSVRGGLLGFRKQSSAMVAPLEIQSSYFDGERSGESSCCGANPPSPDVTSKTSHELRTPTTTAGTIYAGWDRLNVNDVDENNDGNFNDDAPWDFGGYLDYPVLRGVSARFPSGNSTGIGVQRRSQPPVLATLSQRGRGAIAEGTTATYEVELTIPVRGADVVTMSWSVEPVGVGAGHAEASDFVEATRGQVVVANTASAVFGVRVARDGALESRESFRVRLSDLQGPASLRLSATRSAVVSVIETNGMDYDDDDDNLIDVTTTAQLAAIRYDLRGKGSVGVDSGARTDYERAFPFFDRVETCPDGCEGYELSNDLDLSSVGKWTPIGGGVPGSNPLIEEYRYNAVFDGNGHVISNMKITGVFHFAGLFRGLGRDGVIRNVGLIDVFIMVDLRSIQTGALAGANYGGKVAASYVVGGLIHGGWGVGGLVAENQGTIIASYSHATVETGASGVGGLANANNNGGKIIASYASGVVQRPHSQWYNYIQQRNSGGLVSANGAVIERSYYDKERINFQVPPAQVLSPHGSGVPSVSSQTSRALRGPTTAEGIYAGWDALDVDDTSSTVMGVLTWNDDAPWDFGTVLDYPVLRGAVTANVARQFALQPQVTLVVTLTGAATVFEGDAVEYTVSAPVALHHAATAHWSVVATAETGMAAAGDFSDGAGTQLARFPTGTAVIPVGSSTTTFSVYILDDQAPEPGERFTVRVDRVVDAGGRIVWSTGTSSVVISAIELSDGADHDLDDDGLIDVATTSQLSAIRHDLSGRGLGGVSSANRTAYLAAFDLFDVARTCHDSGKGECVGYELLNDLDLSSAGNWTPIGGGFTSADSEDYNELPAESIRYNGVFEGNGYVVRNMEITRVSGSVRYDHVGLFGVLGSEGVIRSVGMEDVNVDVPVSVHVGALVGFNFGKIAASYAVGGSVDGSWAVGGLVGSMYSTRHSAIVIAGYSTVSVDGNGERAGGLIGSDEGSSPAPIVSASYTIGIPTGGDPDRGGLLGYRRQPAAGKDPLEIQSSYFDSEISGESSCCGNNPVSPDDTPKTSAALSTPTAAVGIYAGWDRLNVNDVDENNDGDFNDDAPWDFGTFLDYPVLRGAVTANVARQLASQPQVTLVVTLAGAATTFEGDAVEYTVSVPGALRHAATAHWSVVATTETGMAAAGDFSDDAGTQLARFPAGSVVIPAGSSATTFSIYILDDQAPEPMERFSVRVDRVVGAGARIVWSTGSNSVVTSAIELSDGTDHDLDDDGLIDVATTRQLSAIRHDLSGRGLGGVSSANRTAYLAAFDLFDVARTCHDSGKGECTGYELLNDLDLSSAGNWKPIGGGFSSSNSGDYNQLPAESIRYNGVFEGNGYVVRNMEITRVSGSVRYDHVGLFGVLGSEGVIRSVGMEDVNVDVPVSVHVGALVGFNFGKIAASYAVGGSVDGSRAVGGLVGSMYSGTHSAIVIAGYSTVSVDGNGERAGGLIGSDEGSSPAPIVSASYTIGDPTGGNSVRGGLLGYRQSPSMGVVPMEIQSSYFDSEISGESSCCGDNPVSPDDTPKTSAALSTPTAAVGIYAGWDKLNVNDVDENNDGDFNDDAPWDFGTFIDYPVLRGAVTANVARQLALQPQVTLVVTLAGAATVFEGDAAEYTVSVPGALRHAATAHWSVVATTETGMAAAGDFSDDAGTQLARFPAGSAVIPAGSSATTFSIYLFDDQAPEPVERFSVRVDHVVDAGARIVWSTGSNSVVTPAIESSDGTDYDLDGDGLIEVATTSQLSAIRHDLSGRGLIGVSSANRTAYLAAFDFFDVARTCHDSGKGKCDGYELSTDLDLSGVDWTPLGGGVSLEDLPGDYYTVVFEGNGHVISNLQVIRDGRWHHVGLFGAVSAGGRIRNVGLRNARVSLGSESEVTGALVGHNQGKVAASYVSGGRISGGYSVGGLIGVNDGDVVASYADVEVYAEAANAGGLVGRSRSSARIIASYSVGKTTGSGTVGGLTGGKDVAAVVESSYFDKERSGHSSCCGNNRPSPDDAPKTSGELLFPTTAAGIYAGWDQLNVDDVDQEGDGNLNDDAPWDFGTEFDYPVLVFGGSSDTEQARRTSQQEARPQVSLTPALVGSASAAEGGTASYVVSLPGALPAGVSASWNWAVGGDEVDAGDFVGVTAASVVIVSGASSASFSVAVFDDDVPELSEVFVVTLSNARLTGAPARVGLGVPVSVRSTIELNDGPSYDADGDGLIDVATTSQLTAIRHDLGGAGLAGVSAANRAEYLAAFPFFNVAKTCPNESCAGYELSNDLDLSSVNPAGAGWTPLGGSEDYDSRVGLRDADYYSAVFEGNGHVISNLRMARRGESHHMGLFGAVSTGATIRNVGLRNASVNLALVSGGDGGNFVGALAGRNDGKVAASYVMGGHVSGEEVVGGLIGANFGEVVASYANVEVYADGYAAGGLVGGGGAGSVVSASYSIGEVTGRATVGGLIGSRGASAVMDSSYFDVERSGQSDCCGVGVLDPDDTPQASSELRVPTTAAGTIYAGWHQLNVDDVDQRGDRNFNDDAPWDFGSVFDYPVLVFGGATGTRSARRTSQQEAQPEFSFVPTLTGSETVSEGATASYVVRLPGVLPAGVHARWHWSVGGNEVDAGDFIGVTASSVVIASGASSASFSVTVFDDDVPELSEVFVVTLSNARLAGAPARVRLGVPVSVTTTIEFSDGIAYDADGDGLIDVATTSQLAAIRYDLGGVGIAGVSSAHKADYYAAFPFFDVAKTCPNESCTGYELSNDLDLSSVNPAGSGWTPIGGGIASFSDPVAYYTASFEGNGHVISNLRITRSGRWIHMGLFGAVGAEGTIRNVGLRNAQVDLDSRSEVVGALVGSNEGTVAVSYVSGGRISGGWLVGGLIGGHYDKLVASYANVEVHAHVSNVGGLVGAVGVASVVSASYSAGVTTGSFPIGGLIGTGNFGAAVESSYFDAQRSGQDSCCGLNKPDPDYTSKTSIQLRTPTTAMGTIYAGWDQLNVDGVDQKGDGDYNDDSPWDFGTTFDYPVLVFGGATETRSARRTSQQQVQPGFSLVPTLAGSETVSEGATASYVVRLPEVLPTGVTASWNWMAGGGEVDAGDFVGTTAGSVVIRPGASSASFSLRVRADGVPELSEVIVVSLSNAVLMGALGDVRLRVPSTVARTTITASDLLPVTVAATSATVSENATATFTIRLSGGGDRAVVVEYEITSASADLTPEDLSAVNVVGRAGGAVRPVVALPLTGSVVLNETGTARIEVGVASDQVQDEGRERFRLRLTGCPNCLTEYPAQLGTPSFADVGIFSERVVVVDARVYLQGALLPGSRLMRSDLVNLLPRRQPYGAFPWNYPAATMVPHAGAGVGLAGVTSTIVDWVLVELRTGESTSAAAASRPLTGGRTAGLLLRDGRVAGINEAAATLTDAPSLDGVRFAAELSAGDDLYVLIHHRNHLPVMSALPVAATTGDDCAVDYCVDFRVAQSHADGQVEVAAGAYAMVAGDVDRDGVVGERDEVLIRVRNLTRLGASDYRYAMDADLDFDGEVLSADRYFVIENQGRRRVFSVQ